MRKEANADRVRRLYYENKAAGICVKSGCKAPAGRGVQCDKHADEARKRSAAYKRSNPDRVQASKEGYRDRSGRAYNKAYYQANRERLVEAGRLRREKARQERLTREFWQPIETCPQDTCVMVYSAGYYLAHFNTFYGKWIGQGENTEDSRWINRYTPTHWAPLPEAPVV